MLLLAAEGLSFCSWMRLSNSMSPKELSVQGGRVCAAHVRGYVRLSTLQVEPYPLRLSGCLTLTAVDTTHPPPSHLSWLCSTHTENDKIMQAAAEAKRKKKKQQEQADADNEHDTESAWGSMPGAITKALDKRKGKKAFFADDQAADGAVEVAIKVAPGAKVCALPGAVLLMLFACCKRASSGVCCTGVLMKTLKCNCGPQQLSCLLPSAFFSPTNAIAGPQRQQQGLLLPGPLRRRAH